MRLRETIFRRFTGVVFALSSVATSAQVARLVVTVDQASLPKGEASVFQQAADTTALAINALIPGVPIGYSQTNIVVFQESAEFQTANRVSVPLTLTGVKLVGEPSSTKSGSIRIGVTGVVGLHLQKFVFQLAHELAHVKMGAGISNTMLESIAAQCSDEVLAMMHFYDYLGEWSTPEIIKMPPSVQRLFADSKFAELRPYWQARCAANWNRTGDVGCMALGSALLAARGRPGPVLLNLSRYTVPLPASKGYGTQIRPPDIPALKRLGFPVDALGYVE